LQLPLKPSGKPVEKETKLEGERIGQKRGRGNHVEKEKRAAWQEEIVKENKAGIGLSDSRPLKGEKRPLRN